MDNQWSIVTHRTWFRDNSSGKVRTPWLTPMLCKTLSVNGRVFPALAACGVSPQLASPVRPNVGAPFERGVGRNAGLCTDVPTTGDDPSKNGCLNGALT